MKISENTHFAVISATGKKCLDRQIDRLGKNTTESVSIY